MRCAKCGYTLTENKRVLNKYPYCLTRRISGHCDTAKRKKTLLVGTINAEKVVVVDEIKGTFNMDDM